MTEHDLQNLIKIELNKKGFAVFRANVGSGKTWDGRYFKTGLPKGFPDLFAVKDNKIYFIEVKLPKGRVSEDQKHFIHIMKNNYNTDVNICRSVDDVLRLIERT